MKKLSFAALLAVLIGFAGSCKKDPMTDNFDKTGLFTNYADNLILPAYNAYGTELDAMQTAVNAFFSAPDTNTLAAAQQAILDAYAAWQYCEIYNLTEPADAVQSWYNTNFFPTDTSAVLLNIQSNNNSTTFIESATITQRGFPVLDHLFFSRTLNRAQLLERFTSDTYAASRKTYTSSVISDIRRIQAAIVNAWPSHRNTFINAIGTDAGSSFSIMVNSISQRTDNLKRHQVGIPAGYVGNTPTMVLLPTKSQAYYSNQSIAYMVITLQNLKEVIQGGSGTGLYEYLQHLNATSTIGGDLAEDIMTQLDVCIAKANDCGPDYAATIDTDKAKADALFLEVKKLLVLIKVDMPSAIGVSISYSDNDGD
jgi:predicted lipoprotein